MEIVAACASCAASLPPLVDLYREAGRRAGHPPERLRVGMHALGYVADTDERGWPPVTRTQFEALRSARGALIVGGAEKVAEKILRHSEALGGLDRVTFQMSVGTLTHAPVKRVSGAASIRSRSGLDDRGA